MEIHRLLFSQRRNAAERDQRAEPVVPAELADAARLIGPAADDQVAKQEAFAQVLVPLRQKRGPFRQQCRRRGLRSDPESTEARGARRFA
jgi:hypothetical protein